MKKISLSIVVIIVATFKVLSQGAIHNLNNSEVSESVPSCGSHFFIKNLDVQSPGFLNFSNALIENLGNSTSGLSAQRNYNELLKIPVVFHIVYHEENANLADSIIYNQLEILNDAFRRTNDNASNTRPVFLDLVGDTKIEFVLASTDPNGIPTSGITRTYTDISHFGGVLPYGPNQNNEITQWANDSLFYNWFRITNADLGGVSPWDSERYLNIWIGDLRILQPLFDNFEELVFLGLATPPVDHQNWPADVVGDLLNYEQGVIMHYVPVGSNNPNFFPQPYQNLNSPAKSGKILVHEVGHYLGLRHIWGDGGCNLDDYIDDTPNASNHSSWGCSFNSNTCIDNIGGADLPNMVENYMDYSSGTCQNSFTWGQADLMRSVLELYRPLLAESFSTADLNSADSNLSVNSFPNPVNSSVSFPNCQANADYIIYSLAGVVAQKGKLNHQTADLTNLSPGSYFIEIFGSTEPRTIRIIKD